MRWWFHYILSRCKNVIYTTGFTQHASAMASVWRRGSVTSGCCSLSLEWKPDNNKQRNKSGSLHSGGRRRIQSSSHGFRVIWLMPNWIKIPPYEHFKVICLYNIQFRVHSDVVSFWSNYGPFEWHMELFPVFGATIWSCFKKLHVQCFHGDKILIFFRKVFCFL